MSRQAKGKPWHARWRKVHHDNSRCSQGKRVAKRVEGTGQKPLCQECGRLNNAP